MRRPRYPYKPEDDGFFEEKYPNGSDDDREEDFDYYEGEPIKPWEEEGKLPDGCEIEQ